MKFQWTRNMFGQTLTDEELRVINYPLLELTVHITTKTIQAGAILGMIVIGPTIGLLRGPRNLGAITSTAIRAGQIGALIGIPLGPGMTYAKMNAAKIDDDGLYDRCYRLRYNRNQVRTDRFAYLGAAGGAVGAVAMGTPLSTGALVGFVAGTLLGGLYNSSVAEKSS